MDHTYIAMITAQLMGGSEFIHEVHVPKFVKMAITITIESRKQLLELEGIEQIPVPDIDEEKDRVG
jgi:hypothetical protein